MGIGIDSIYVSDVYDEPMGKIGRNVARRDSFAEELRSWRKRRNLSQTLAAARLKVSPRTLQNWEQGHRAPQGFALYHLREKIK
jgi:putative transcriptional regulator